MNISAGDKAAPEQGERGFLPDFCRLQNLLLVVVSAELLAMVLALGESEDFVQALSLLTLYVQWIALTGIALICTLRPWLQRLDDRLAGLLAWLILQGVTLAVAGFALQLLEESLPDLHIAPTEHGSFVLRSLGISAIVCALALRHLYVQHLWREQVVAESQARLQALQARIRPHFLFNSMNTIASLTRSRPEIAEEVVQDLADLFRASLAETGTLSTLGDELALVRGYLHIETQRLGERLQVEWDLDDIPQEAVIPPLMLQPLVENAVYHGIEPTTSPGYIRITGRYHHHMIHLNIHNSLPPAGTGSHRNGNRMALENIRLRLEGVFGPLARMSSSETAEEYEVQLAFPHPWRLK